MSKKNNAPLTCMQLVRRNCMIKCCIFVPFLLLTLPVVIMMLLEMNTIGESVVPFIICLAISAVSIINLFAAIRGQIAPSKSHLGKCVLLYGGGASSVEELFAQVDKDIQESSRIYKNIYIGKDWILGKNGIAFSNASAAKIPHIKAIFYHHLIKNQSRHEFGIHTVDKDYNDIVFKFKKHEDMSAAYEALCAINPDVENGSHEEWKNYMQQSYNGYIKL